MSDIDPKVARLLLLDELHAKSLRVIELEYRLNVARINDEARASGGLLCVLLTTLIGPALLCGPTTGAWLARHHGLVWGAGIALAVVATLAYVRRVLLMGKRG